MAAAEGAASPSPSATSRAARPASSDLADKVDNDATVKFAYRVTVLVWYKHSVQGQCNNHAGPESRVSAKPSGSPCTGGNSGLLRDFFDMKL